MMSRLSSQATSSLKTITISRLVGTSSEHAGGLLVGANGDDLGKGDRLERCRRLFDSAVVGGVRLEERGAGGIDGDAGRRPGECLVQGQPGRVFDDDVVRAEVDRRVELELLEDLRLGQMTADLEDDV